MSKMFLIVPLALTLSGCATLKQLETAATVATTSIVNPVHPVDIYRVKNIYAAALTLFRDYREYCWSKPYAVLMADTLAKPLCQNRRLVVKRLWVASAKASNAIGSADKFVASNPTINAQALITTAWQAVTDFRDAVPAVN